jgi:hypothetical protein
MIKGLIKANNEGFKNTSKQTGIENIILNVRSAKPTKFQKRQIAFDATNFKNPAPTSFSTQQIKENSVYAPKEFNKLNYSEDPFKEFFGYTKRINPDDNINPKFYEYNLGRKNENSFILENLQAENGTATKDVEQREALKDFLELRRLQEEADKLKPVAKPEEEKEVEEVGGLEAAGGARPRRKKSEGAIAVEPAVNKFKEFEEKTKIKEFEVVPTSTDINGAVTEAIDYIEGKTKDRSGVIKFNKYLKMFGIKPITGKENENSITKIQSKYDELKEKRKYIKERPARNATKIQKSFRGILGRAKANEEKTKPKTTRGAGGGVASGEEEKRLRENREFVAFHKDAYATTQKAKELAGQAVAPPGDKEFKSVALPTAPPIIQGQAPAPPKETGGGVAGGKATERAGSPPKGASPLKATGDTVRAGSVPGHKRSKTPIRAKTPTQEVIAQLPTVVASRQDLEEMIKDFEDVVKGRELTDKLTQTEIEKLKKYNIYYNKGQIDGRSTIKSVELKLRMARLDIKEKALVPAKAKGEVAGGAGAEKLPS